MGKYRNNLKQIKLNWYINEYEKLTVSKVDSTHLFNVKENYYMSEKFSTSEDSFFSFYTTFNNLKIDIRLFSKLIYERHSLVPVSIFYESTIGGYSFHYYSSRYEQVVASKYYTQYKEDYFKILRKIKLEELGIK